MAVISFMTQGKLLLCQGKVKVYGAGADIYLIPISLA